MQELLDDHNATYNPDGKVPGSIPTQLFPTGAHPICISRVVEIPSLRIECQKDLPDRVAGVGKCPKYVPKMFPGA